MSFDFCAIMMIFKGKADGGRGGTTAAEARLTG